MPRPYLDVPPGTFFSCERRREQVYIKTLLPPPMQRPRLPMSISDDRKIGNIVANNVNISHFDVGHVEDTAQLSSQYSAPPPYEHACYYNCSILPKITFKMYAYLVRSATPNVTRSYVFVQPMRFFSCQISVSPRTLRFFGVVTQM